MNKKDCTTCHYYRDDDLFEKCSRRPENDTTQVCIWYREREKKC